MRSDYFVFIDTAGRRWTRVRLFFLVSAALIFLALVSFVHALFIAPRLHRLSEVTAENDLKALIRPDQRVSPLSGPPAWLTSRSGVRKVLKSDQAHLKEPEKSFVRLGFFVNWDPNSLVSLRQNHGKLTHLSPEWLSMADSSGEIFDQTDPLIVQFAAAEGLALMPLLTNLHGNVWQPEAIENLAHGSAEKRLNFFISLTGHLKAAGASGVLIDWEDVDPAYRHDITNLIAALAAHLHEQKLELWLGVPVEQDLRVFDLDGLAPHVDRFVALLFDETGEQDTPGPIASREWFSAWLSALLEHGSPSQWIVALGNFAYDWPDGGAAQTISFVDALSRAEAAGNAHIHTSGPYFEPHYYYQERGVNHSVWFLDAITFRNQKMMAREAGAGGIALSRLGTEDPLVWEFINSHHGIKRTQLKRIRAPAVVAHVGSGELISFENQPRDGRREITAAADGMWNEKFISTPSLPTIYHRPALDPHWVALTFDDGPDPRWTPPILDILKARNLKAAFFCDGRERVQQSGAAGAHSGGGASDWESLLFPPGPVKSLVKPSAA